VGLVAGLLTFIPYVGALVGGALSIGLALFQFWGEWWSIIAVALVFQAGQLVEGNILTPKLVGSSVGLHPVWLIFALSAFGTIFGFVGMLDCRARRRRHRRAGAIRDGAVSRGVALPGSFGPRRGDGREA
jgi:hypothetical protein